MNVSPVGDRVEAIICAGRRTVPRNCLVPSYLRRRPERRGMMALSTIPLMPTPFGAPVSISHLISTPLQLRTASARMSVARHERSGTPVRWSRRES
jgi:hypothetical protein